MLSESERDRHAERIRRDGYSVLEGAIAESDRLALIAALERIRADHDLGPARTRFEGYRTVRINNLLAYDETFWQVPLHPDALAIAERLLDPELLLTSFCSLICTVSCARSVGRAASTRRRITRPAGAHSPASRVWCHSGCQPICRKAPMRRSRLKRALLGGASVGIRPG